MMHQQVVVSSQTELSLKPLLESAIRSELKGLKHALGRTQARLVEFEQRYGMNTAEFERRFRSHDLEESLDFLDWWGEIQMLALLEKRQQHIGETAVISAQPPDLAKVLEEIEALLPPDMY